MLVVNVIRDPNHLPNFENVVELTSPFLSHQNEAAISIGSQPVDHEILLLRRYKLAYDSKPHHVEIQVAKFAVSKLELARPLRYECAVLIPSFFYTNLKSNEESHAPIDLKYSR